MLMSKAILVFLIVFTIKSCSAFVDRIRREVYSEECGTHSTANGLMANGTLFSRGLWPWNVAIYDIRPREYFCGGVIITKTFVLTAAHCLHPKHTNRKDDENIMMIYGAYDLLNTNEHGTISKSLYRSYIHEDWNPNTNRFDADIALLEIESPIEYTNFIKPICLWTGDNSLDEIEATVVGWDIENLQNKPILEPMELSVPIVKNEKCFTEKGDLETISSKRTFCGGARDGLHTPCYGDSGRGLYVKYEKKYYLRGLVSSSTSDNIKKCDATTYTVYTNVFMFTVWIKKTAGIVRTEPSSCFVNSMKDYTCKVSAHIKHETDVLNFSDSHMEGKNDNDVMFLNLDDSTFDRIPSFKNFNKLTNLKMWNAKLKEITESSFTSCPNLISLGLRFNKLAKIPSGAFKDLKHLIGLGVNCNPIVEIEQNAFQGLVSLQHLFLCATKLTVINEETFLPLAGLKMLHLNHTLIETIHSNAFTTLIRLWYLNLENGRLTSIDENVLKPLRSLQYLLLNNNLIQYIHEDAFKSLTKLKRLSLRENKLQMLSSSLFLSQGKLEQLSIKDNQIWFMEKGALNNFKVLTKFDARGNSCVDKIYQNAIDFGAIETLCENDSNLVEKKLT